MIFYINLFIFIFIFGFVGTFGKNKEFFEIYKFRSMYTETPNVSTEALGDPSVYITKVGKFIRKTSLDELP